MDVYIPSYARARANRRPEFALFCKDALQGVVSALLTLVGAAQVIAGDISPLNTPTDAAEFLPTGNIGGRMIGAVEIIAALFLFLSAPRAAARTFGVLIFLAYLIFQNSGLTGRDVTASISQFARLLLDSVEMFGAGA